MTTIGLLSDTHHYLDPAIYKHFQHCDEIWHAGDFGTDEIANALAAFKPLRGVYGNIDGQDIRSNHPLSLSWKTENVQVLMTHIGGYPPKYNPSAKKLIVEMKPKLFICGHSHILKVMYDKAFNCLHMNPGAAGKQGWHQISTLIRFCIDDSEIKNCQVIELGSR